MKRQRIDLPMQFVVTLSRELRQFENATDYLEDVISKCPVPFTVAYDDVYIPSKEGSMLVQFQGKTCKCVRRAVVTLSGEYGLEEVEGFFGNLQDHINVSIGYLYDGVA